jgi:hypothetical protein
VAFPFPRRCGRHEVLPLARCKRPSPPNQKEVSSIEEKSNNG